MLSISLNTAASITALSKRTLWRHIEKGSLSALSPLEAGGQTRVSLSRVLPLSSLTLEPGDEAVIVAADAGEAVAQCDLAIMLLTAKHPKEAIYWLTLSAKQFYPDAMCFLGQHYLSGVGVSRDPEVGLMWLSQAATKGHLIAEGMLAFLLSPAGQQQTQVDPAALDAALNKIGYEILLQALNETADQRDQSEGVHGHREA